MSSEFQRMQQLAGINEVKITPQGEHYAVFNHYDTVFYTTAPSLESMLNKLNTAFKEIMGESSYTPYDPTDFDYAFERVKNHKKIGTYISDDWATATDDKNEFDTEMGLHNPPPEKYKFK